MHDCVLGEKINLQKKGIVVSLTKNWTLEEVENEVFRIVKEEKQLGEEFAKNTSFVEVGLDSLSLVRILVAIDNSMGVWLEGGALTPENLRDVKSLAISVQSLMDGGVPASQ